MEQRSGFHSFLVPICICALWVAALPSTTQADENWEMDFQPHAEIGIADYNVEFSSVSQIVGPGHAFSASKLKFDAVMPTLGAGLTVFAKRYFLDISAQRMQTFDQSMSDSHTIVSSTPDTLSIIQNSYSTDDFSRDEYALSLGYGITETVSVYAGYKRQYSNINQLAGGGPGEIEFANGQVWGVNFVTMGDYKFDYDGPFIGGTTAWKFNNETLNGRLSFSAAVAFLHGSMHIESESTALIRNDGLVLPDNTKASELFDTSGDAVGITLGAAWMGQTNIEGLSYSIAVNGYSYDFSADEQDRSDFSEEVLQLKLGLGYAL